MMQQQDSQYKLHMYVYPISFTVNFGIYFIAWIHGVFHTALWLCVMHIPK
jgi:hypothetical protein